MYKSHGDLNLYLLQAPLTESRVLYPDYRSCDMMIELDLFSTPQRSLQEVPESTQAQWPKTGLVLLSW